MLVNYLFASVFVMVMVMTMVMVKMMMITLMMAFIFVNHVCGRSPQVGGARSEKSKSGSNKRKSSRLLNNFVSFLFEYFDDVAGDDDGSGDDAKFFQLNEVGIKADAVNLFEDHDVCSERHTKPTNHEPSQEKSSA